MSIYFGIQNVKSFAATPIFFKKISFVYTLVGFIAGTYLDIYTHHNANISKMLHCECRL